MSDETSFLFPIPSFFEGMGRLIDFRGSLSRYNYAPTGEEADRVALAMDWKAVAGEISRAAETVTASR